jgi:nucleoid-associated protein YgaU
MSTALNAAIIPFPRERVAADAARTSARTSARTVAKTHLHLTRRGRVVLTTIAAVPLVVAAAVFALNGGGAVASNEGGASASFSHVTVSSGQSLWQIAERVAPSADPRDVVAAIVDLNQLHTSMLMPGQRLAIPAEYSH